MKTFKSDISDKEFPETDRISGRTIRPMIMDLIRQDSSSFGQESNISLSELNFYREKYISQFLLKEIGELSELEKNVMTSVSEESTLSDKINKEDTDSITYGQHIADKVAIFGGSWTFIISFGVFLVIWIMVNAFWLSNKGFDPYPFILLNLILSCLAAMQAPVIMMSQNRQEEKDRERAKKDYMINLKSELEIRILHEKIDHLIMKQQQELLEIQKVQIDMMNDILTQVNLKKSA
ncbi:MAG: DUF1003 domain-containing protein [Saprospiraceae bacterium]|nr:DUF1003 domain-containing protein [Saprospiraceae bacterium]MBK6479720.1 DUF1003 domain-containing protein [Saprospiraceae bacterium]MBK7372469.1 DUF1003 domain-containing protein [Saprospiraceae bacterium]MBK7439098.1 DUF1003 domain-containing protein [Saprospiraceae bacterium]MBK8282480.1 DUF1003 domain-containing protein [Saprospiraceae bacterium]